MNCPHCGTTAVVSAQFCAQCGFRFQLMPVPAQAQPSSPQQTAGGSSGGYPPASPPAPYPAPHPVPRPPITGGPPSVLPQQPLASRRSGSKANKIALGAIIGVAALAAIGGAVYWAVAPACKTDSDCGRGRWCIWPPDVGKFYKRIGVTGEPPPAMCVQLCEGTPESPSGSVDNPCGPEEKCIPEFMRRPQDYCRQGVPAYIEKLKQLQAKQCAAYTWGGEKNRDLLSGCQDRVRHDNPPSDAECVKWSGVCLADDAPQKLDFDMRKMGTANTK